MQIGQDIKPVSVSMGGVALPYGRNAIAQTVKSVVVLLFNCIRVLSC